MCHNCMNRREFVGLTTVSITAGILGLGVPVFAKMKIEEWDPNKSLISTGKKFLNQYN